VDGGWCGTHRLQEAVIGTLLQVVAIVLVANVFAGMLRVVVGPSARDRLLGVVLLGTTGVALLVLLAHVTDVPALRDTALVLVALAALVAVVRIRAEGRRP
jgi:multicomponent Na+:H+ antiporter subunit F